ncbi:hypothetical protein HQ403_03245 [Candidatus Kaiserbacteria bacterium]|nr:hypothetical protein [Candidatus Kaiserbacteria bacterium]
MFIIYILIIGSIVGYVGSLKKVRYSFWVYLLSAFLGSFLGGMLSFGDSPLFLKYLFVNVWVVTSLFSVLFTLAVLFLDRREGKKMIGVAVVTLLVLFSLFYSDSAPSNYGGLFQEELTRAGVERVGQPIEGFNAFILLEAFSGFIEEDFDGVVSLEGRYSYNGSELVYTRTGGNPVTSAEETISSEGYGILLDRLSGRFNVNVNTEGGVALILEKLREGDPVRNSYIHDDFSIWYPEGWYAYENNHSIFFSRDEDLDIPANTDGFALSPWFQVTVESIGIEELFKQNLWNDGSEFLISKDNVRIGADEAIRVVTKAAGAGGDVLHYVFEAIDGRVFTLSHYPYERGSSDTDDFERAVQSFIINYVVDGNTNGNGTTGILPFESGAMGKVLIGPTCPVQRTPLDPNCADKGYATTVQVRYPDPTRSSLFSSVETDKEGNYKVMLPPGEYRLQALGGNPFPFCNGKDITIEPDTMIEIALSCDTGIR